MPQSGKLRRWHRPLEEILPPQQLWGILVRLPPQRCSLLQCLTWRWGNLLPQRLASRVPHPLSLGMVSSRPELPLCLQGQMAHLGIAPLLAVVLTWLWMSPNDSRGALVVTNFFSGPASLHTWRHALLQAMTALRDSMVHLSRVWVHHKTTGSDLCLQSRFARRDGSML